MTTNWASSLGDESELATSPVALLGILSSAPPLVPHALLRRIRREVFGPGTLHLEAQLYDSDVVSSVSKDGIELEPEFRAAARALLRQSVQTGRVPSSDLRSVTRCDDLGLSPLLVLEEQLTWAYISAADPRPDCDALLTDCLMSIVREGRRRVLDWASGALHRFPDLVLETPAAWLLSEVCNALQRHTRHLEPPPMQNLSPALLHEVLQIVPPALVGFHRDGYQLHLGFINQQRRMAFAVPGIALRPVTVTWTEANRPAPDAGASTAQHLAPDAAGRVQQVTVDVMDRTPTIPVGAAEVTLRNAIGDVVILREFEQGTTPPELVELDEHLDLIEDAWRQGHPVSAEILRPLLPGGFVVRFTDAPMLTSHLRLDQSLQDDAVSARMVGEVLDVRISNFNRPNQRILCRAAGPIEAHWSPGNLEIGMECVGQIVKIVKFGILVMVPATDQGFDGRTIVGLIHKSQFPRTWKNRPPRLTVGDSLEVEVIDIDFDARRISFTIGDHSEGVLAALQVGAVMVGQVTSILPFGVFVRVRGALDGLLHSSEIAADREIAIDDELLVRVIAIDRDRKRVNLGAEPRLPAGAPSKLTQRMEMIQQFQEGSDAMLRTQPATVDANLRPLAAEVTSFLREKLRELQEPLALNFLAQIVADEFGDNVTSDWLGFSRFKEMLHALVPEARTDTRPPGTVLPF